uniref:G-protein coupled receptors family 1 profile domain-containing protein n=1 Tax=Myripristis murdjan TaxID=586833 RepID=A0A667ZAW5_9TELE
MENYTYNSFTLHLEALPVTEDSVYPVFLIIFFSYLFIMFANVGIIVIVCIEKSLHQPMYFLFCNLSVNDILGNTNMLPRLLSNMVLPPSERLISYYECVAQAFTIHTFATASHTILMIMAFDRTVITNLYCDNASLFKLSCESVFINNVYGLTFTVVLLTSSVGSMVLTYTKITAVCLTSKNTSLNSKALKTCSTHLCLYLIMFFSGMVPIALHRFPQYTFQKKVWSILLHVIPGTLNPVIYGAQSKEIRKFLLNMFHLKKKWDFKMRISCCMY